MTGIPYGSDVQVLEGDLMMGKVYETGETVIGTVVVCPATDSASTVDMKVKPLAYSKRRNDKTVHFVLAPPDAPLVACYGRDCQILLHPGEDAGGGRTLTPYATNYGYVVL